MLLIESSKKLFISSTPHNSKNMIVKDLRNSYNPVPKTKENKKKKRKDYTEIPKRIKEIVWNRDKHKCIFCGKLVDVFYANAHFIPRSAGGLGIEKNIFTACEDCHREQDNGLNTKLYDLKAEKHLKGIYGANWDKTKLVYKKENYL